MMISQVDFWHWIFWRVDEKSACQRVVHPDDRNVHPIVNFIGSKKGLLMIPQIEENAECDKFDELAILCETHLGAFLQVTSATMFSGSV